MIVALEFLLPDVGEGLAEATVLRWLVAVGDRVGIDEPLVEVETDKAVLEIPAPRAGVVLHHGASEGETLEVDGLLAVIGDPGETWVAREAPAVPVEGPRHREAADAAPLVGILGGPDAPGGGGALPAVRRLAADLGVDLTSVAGTGPGGRVTKSDVEAAAAPAGPVDRVRLSATRLAVARNMTRSWREIPHVVTFGEADSDPLLAARAASAASTGESVPLEALLVRIVVPLLREYPEFNATLEDDQLLLRRHYDIGFAVDTPEGLMVAVIHGADHLGTAELAVEVNRLAAAARERTVAPEELRGATFTISNIGAVGGGFGTPIIPYGTTAILSVGRADLRPVVRDGASAVARTFPLSLSYDHRVIDGALGRRFLGSVIATLEGFDDA